MKINELHNQPVSPDTYEASMALNQLLKIGKHAIKIHNMIDDHAEMESWVAKKIDLAGDYVKKVHGYMQGEKAGLYDDGGMTEIKKMPKGTGTMYGVKEDAPFGSGMDLVRMAVMRKFISAEEYMNYGNELKAAAEETAENYDDWPEGEGFGSSDGNFAIKDMMDKAGYEFDEQDRGGRFIVTKMPEKLEKMGIKNVRMRDAVTTEDAGNMDLIGDGAENLGLDPNKFDYYYDTSGAGYGEVRTKSGKSILQFEYDRDGDAEVSTMDNKTIANIKQGEQLPNNVTAKLNMIKEDAGDQDDWTKLLNAVAQRYGKEKARVIHDYAQHGTDSGRELMRDYGLTPGDGWWEDQPQWFKKFPWLEKLDKTSWMSRLVDIAGQGPEYGGAGYEYPKGLESAVQEDLDYRSEDILNKAGFDPADIDTYMKVFNDHGDTSDLEQMNMKEKVGLAEVMSIVLASHGIQNESYQPFPEADEFNIEDDEDFEEVLGPLGFPEDETELFDAEYRGRKVPLNKPMRGDVKKFKVFVRDPKTKNIKKVNFGDPNMRIKKSNPARRRSFRARHNCDNPGPRTKARYWSCRKW